MKSIDFKLVGGYNVSSTLSDYHREDNNCQFRDIKRQQDIKESLYLYLLQKREETAITLGMSSPNAKIVNHSFSSTTPVSPNKKITYLACSIY